jgi:hypothetical protein
MAAMENTKRIHLLSSTELEELYARPEFDAHEQRLYFTLTQSERAALAQFSNTKTRIYFILQLGYFKAKQQFFNFSLDEVYNDVQFIMGIYYKSAFSLVSSEIVLTSMHMPLGADVRLPITDSVTTSSIHQAAKMRPWRTLLTAPNRYGHNVATPL